jgi:TatD DNase family protein
MLIDSHAHLDYEYEQSPAELLALARAVGVNRVIAIAAAANSLDRVRELAEEFPNVYFSSGIHPHDSKDFTPEIFARIKELAKHPRCVAIGELGLDYFYELSDKPLQFEALKTQLDFSVEIGKPVVVHTRSADEDTVKFLTPHAEAFRAKHGDRSPGVIHCFTGTADLARACLGLGYHISFSGIITFKTAGDLREVVKDVVPLERMLVETDSPFLAPIPHRGKKNMPAHTRVVAEKVAELKGLSIEEIARVTCANTERLFGIPTI